MDGEQALHDLEEDIIVMQDANEDTAIMHHNSEHSTFQSACNLLP